MGRYTDKKVNNTPKANKIRKQLEEYGHKNVEVWWENIHTGCEMGGYEGGWFFCSNWEDKQDGECIEEDYFEPIGYSFQEVLETIKEYDLREE